MSGKTNGTRRRFHVALVKPSHYDEDGYVIQWWKAWIPSNSLAAVYGLTLDVNARRVMGEDVEIDIQAYDEINTVIPVDRIIRDIEAAEAGGLVCMVGVQSNQFPRAMDLARRFRAADIPVAVGGFHVSGCLSMLDEMPPDLIEARDLGVSLYAGEAEGRLDEIFVDSMKGALKPAYNYLDDLPGLEDQVVPFLPEHLVRKYDGMISSF
ncbi:MAG: radical SAM protein, partial [Alphaproteobacteria bacterium]